MASHTDNRSTSSTSPSSSDGELQIDIEKQESRNASIKGQSRAQGEAESEGKEEDDQWNVEPEPDLLDTNASGATGALGRVLSRISTNASWNPGPPPDGGRNAWIMCKQDWSSSQGRLYTDRVSCTLTANMQVSVGT